MQFTAADVVALRQGLGLTRAQFASLVGVSASTVFRWESTLGVLNVDPMQRQIFAALQQQLAAPNNQAAQLGQAVGKALLIGGGLFALYKLLEAVFDED